MRQITFSSICNQIPGDAQRWAYFDVSFEAPAGYRYVRSALNVGDMRIWLANRGWRPGQIMLRQVYPAQLALQRFRLELWMEQMVYDQRREYQITRLRSGAAAGYDKLRTPHGDGLMCEVMFVPVERILIIRRIYPKIVECCLCRQLFILLN